MPHRYSPLSNVRVGPHYRIGSSQSRLELAQQRLYPPVSTPSPSDEPGVRDSLMDNIAFATAFDGGADDQLYEGLPEDDPIAEYSLVYLRDDRAFKEFEAEGVEHYQVRLKRVEREWLAGQVGFIVEEQHGAGYTSVYFYSDLTDLNKAWSDVAERVEELNKELVEEAVKSGQYSPSGQPFTKSQTRLEAFA